MSGSVHPIRAIVLALTGFALWVIADSCMKLAGEAELPPYEVVGFMGLFAGMTIASFFAAQGKVRELWPKKPMPQVLRSLMAFGCVMSNAVALKHLPLTVFYVVVFTSPMIIALLAAVFLREHLTWQKIIAIVVGFCGVVFAIDPWANLGSGDWIGYAAASAASLFFSLGTVMLRFTSQSETTHSIIFMTALVEVVLSAGLMMWHVEPVSWSVLAIMAVMGSMNGIGNLFNANALQLAPAATVEQFHYTQIVFGALVGFAVWHEIPTQHTIIGAVVIIASGLYIAASAHQADKNPV